MTSRGKILAAVLSAVFACGLLLILCAEPLLKAVSIGLEYEYFYSWDPEEVQAKTISCLIAGSILSLLSGSGLLSMALKFAYTPAPPKKPETACPAPGPKQE